MNVYEHGNTNHIIRGGKSLTGEVIPDMPLQLGEAMGSPTFTSYWAFTPEELEAIKSGTVTAIKVTLLGSQPPIKVEVDQ